MSKDKHQLSGKCRLPVCGEPKLVSRLKRERHVVMDFLTVGPLISCIPQAQYPYPYPGS